jgi:hypothetical protein
MSLFQKLFQEPLSRVIAWLGHVVEPSNIKKSRRLVFDVRDICVKEEARCLGIKLFREEMFEALGALAESRPTSIEWILFNETLRSAAREIALFSEDEISAQELSSFLTFQREHLKELQEKLEAWHRKAKPRLYLVR